MGSSLDYISQTQSKPHLAKHQEVKNYLAGEQKKKMLREGSQRILASSSYNTQSGLLPDIKQEKAAANFSGRPPRSFANRFRDSTAKNEENKDQKRVDAYA